MRVVGLTIKKPCIKDFKEENLNSYDFADNWGTAQYERRVMCAWYETKFKTKWSMKRVLFDDNDYTLLVQYEDRNSEWMNNAIDRAHWKSRV